MFVTSALYNVVVSIT